MKCMGDSRADLTHQGKLFILCKKIPSIIIEKIARNYAKENPLKYSLYINY